MAKIKETYTKLVKQALIVFTEQLLFIPCNCMKICPFQLKLLKK